MWLSNLRDFQFINITLTGVAVLEADWYIAVEGFPIFMLKMSYFE